MASVRVGQESTAITKLHDDDHGSGRPVAYHLRQIYRKLEIRSRVELTRMVMSQAG